MKIKTVKNLKNLAGKRVLLRSDFNVPLKNGRVADDYKIIKNLATIKYLLKNKAKIIIISHLGRPKPGEKIKKFSIRPVAEFLDRVLKSDKVKFVDDICGFAAGTAVAGLRNRDILFLENIRYEPGEKKNSAVFAAKLSKFADIYVNDAFAVSHRKHASVSAIKKHLPAYSGLLLEKEIEQLQRAKEAKKPLIVIIGGAKLQTKMSLLKKMRTKAHRILIGGALANNFLSAYGYPVGRSLLDPESVSLAKKMIAEKQDKNIVLPIDAVVSNKKSFWDAHYVGLKDVKKNDYIFDIGPKTIDFYKKFIKEAATIIWNGPMGMFEEKKFKHGTLSIARSLAVASAEKAFCVAGGGETVEALRMAKVDGEINWLSTGGGAMLAYLADEKMPGLEGIIR